MSIDLTAAVEAAALEHLGIDSADQAEPLDVHYAKKHIYPVVAVALPLIEAAVREQIARDIKAEADRLSDVVPESRLGVLGFASSKFVRIARGES